MFFTPATAALLRRTHRSPAFHSLDRLFDDALHTSARPAAQIKQDEQAYTLSFDVPGISREKLSIGIEGSVVRIESAADAPRRFKAAYELPQDIDVSASDAKLENGVLTLKLAKQVPASKVTELAIN